MKKISLSILISIFISIQAIADVYEHPISLKTLSTEIPKMGGIKCKFRQEKHIQNIDKPLVSSGDFEFIENRGDFSTQNILSNRQ